MVQLKVRRVYESGPVQGFMAVMIMAVSPYNGQTLCWSKRSLVKEPARTSRAPSEAPFS